MKNPCKTLGSKKIYKNKWLALREDDIICPDGSKGIYSVVETNRSICILPIENDNIYLVNQYRYPINNWSLEICAGGNDGHENDSVLDIAKAELKEELGLIAKRWQEVFKWHPANGFCNEICYLFIAKNFTFTKQNLDPAEAIEIKKITIKKFGELVKNGKITDAFTIIAYYKLMEYLDK